MIPKAYIDAWRSTAPWQENAQVEQDLVISRAIIEIFSHDLLRKHLAFRGGTAIHKLFLKTQARYSEDIDLVQLDEGPIKPILQALRDQLLFLGDKKDRRVESSEHNWTVFYSFNTEYPPPPEMRVKIEINTREHFNVIGLKEKSFHCNNPWYNANTDIITYQPEELLGTKLRALYQRKKGRDLFDLNYALKHLEVDNETIIQCFQTYIENNNNRYPTSSEFDLNMKKKLDEPEFIGDVKGLLRPEIEYNHIEAYDHIYKALIAHI